MTGNSLSDLTQTGQIWDNHESRGEILSTGTHSSSLGIERRLVIVEAICIILLRRLSPMYSHQEGDWALRFMF